MSSLGDVPRHVYVGTFTRGVQGRGQADGISVCRYDPATGGLTHQQTLADVANPSFLALHPHRPLLYSVNAVPEQDGRPGGSVSAFAIDPATGDLTYLNRQPTHGAGPCHVAVEATGRWVCSASYGGGSVAMFPIEADGRLGPPSDFHQHVGSSIHPERQTEPHAHSLTFDPANRFALVCDLGQDRVIVYRLDLAHGKLLPNEPAGAPAAPGAGPRHLDFHPNGRFVYVLNEINSTLTTYAYDAERGALSELQALSTLPTGYDGPNSTADVHVAPSGRFVYSSNRGHDSLAIFAIDAASGRLSPVGHQSTGGRTPRNFAIDPSGAWLLAANQDSDTIVTFQIDQATGHLTPTGQVIETPTPVCLKFR